MPDCGEPFTGTDLSNLDNARCRRIAGAFFVFWASVVVVTCCLGA